MLLLSGSGTIRMLSQLQEQQRALEAHEVRACTPDKSRQPRTQTLF